MASLVSRVALLEKGAKARAEARRDPKLAELDREVVAFGLSQAGTGEPFLLVTAPAGLMP